MSNLSFDLQYVRNDIFYIILPIINSIENNYFDLVSSIYINQIIISIRIMI